MSFHCFLIPFLLAIVTIVQAEMPKVDPKLKEQLTAMITDCQKTSRASEADLSAIRDKKMPASHEGQCLMECVFSATKIMNNGNFDKDSALKVLTPHMKGDAEKTKKLAQMLETCEKEIGKDTDKCVTARKLVECSEKHGKEFGFQMPVHM